jgi:glycosyltransferase involved in cell wall biosynthesis
VESRPLNFLHLTTFYPPYSFGGDAVFLYRLCHRLGDAGHHVDVVHCIDAYHLLHPSPPSVAFAEHPRVRRHELRSGYRWLSPLLTQQTGRPLLKMKTIRRLLAERPYDVVHFHNTSLLGPHLLKLQPQNEQFVKLYTTHEHWLICPMHVLWKFDRQACDRPQCLRCVLKGRKPPQLWRYTGTLKRCGAHVDQFVSPSRFTARMHAERGFPYPVEHLPYFIEPADADWHQPGPRPHERPYVLIVGRLERIKGIQTVIPLWSRIQDADLLLVGTGNYEAELRAQAAGNPRIHFLGARSPRDLGNLYYHAVTCIIPSITFETFGMINIEAFARKTPVVVRDLGALPEVVNEANGGFVYQHDDQLVDAVNRLIRSRTLRDELGENGYRTFLEKWTGEAHMKMYFEYLDRAAVRKYNGIPWRDRQAATVI